MISITLPNRRQFSVADRTPAAVIMAALTATQHLDIDDIRHIGDWSRFINEDYFDSAEPNRSLSVIGVLALYIACGVLGEEFPDDLDEEKTRFMDEVRKLAPAVILDGHDSC